jgi:hypothetical protein
MIAYCLKRRIPKKYNARPVREHLLGAPWTRLVNEGYLVDLTGQGFYKVTEEGMEYLAQEEEGPTSFTSAKLPGSTGAPRAFLSYSWDSLDHQQWVAKFAERLQGGSGVESSLIQYARENTTAPSPMPAAPPSLQ